MTARAVTRGEMLDLLDRMKRCQHQVEIVGGGKLILVAGRDVLTYEAIVALIKKYGPGPAMLAEGSTPSPGLSLETPNAAPERGITPSNCGGIVDGRETLTPAPITPSPSEAPKGEVEEAWKAVSALYEYWSEDMFLTKGFDKKKKLIDDSLAVLRKALAPAPLPAEVEKALNRLPVWDFIPAGWEMPLGFDHIVADAKAALDVLRKATTKRVSREWVYNHMCQDFTSDDAVDMLHELGYEVTDAE